VLSRPEVRAQAYAAIDTWMRAWVESGPGEDPLPAEAREGS
jgi:hypothetical protein